MKYSLSGERILLTFWIGGMWAIGYVVTPTLFDMLDDRILAGTIAGRLFTIMSYAGLFCGGLLLAGQLVRAARNWLRSARVWALAVMLAVILVGEFALTPAMVELRDSGLAEGGRQAARFARLHGISATLFLINSLLGLGLVAFGLAGNGGRRSEDAEYAKVPRSQRT